MTIRRYLPPLILIIAGAWLWRAGIVVPGGPIVVADFRPTSVAADTRGNIFVGDGAHRCVWKVSQWASVEAVVRIRRRGLAADGGAQGQVNVSFFLPHAIAVDAKNNVYIADYGSASLFKLSKLGMITTIRKNGRLGHRRNRRQAMKEHLGGVLAMAVDLRGNLYVAQPPSVLKVDRKGFVTNIWKCQRRKSGSGGLYGPRGIAVDVRGNVYVSDTENDCIRKIDEWGNLTRVAGSGGQGFSRDGGDALNAMLSEPYGIALDSKENLYIADWLNGRIRKVDTAGIITTVAGTGRVGSGGDGGQAVKASLGGPQAVSCDADVNLYFSDVGRRRIRKVDTFGIITTVVASKGRFHY